jgi:septum formation protein
MQEEQKTTTLITTGEFILASASPRRNELLKNIGLEFTVEPGDVDETGGDGEPPRDLALRLSREKAQAISRRHPDAWVLGADTVVVIGEEVMGKPKTPAEARDMLGKLSGREHRVFTGFTIAGERAGVLVGDVVESAVLFRNISPGEMAWYVESDEPYDKAGGYAAQGKSALFIRAINGSYTNVMGLPLCEVVDALKSTGVIRFAGEGRDGDDRR